MLSQRRGAALLALLFQFLLVVVLPVVHAAAETETLRHVPHVEAQNGGRPCPASHEEACTTCRVLHHTAVLALAARVANAPAILAEPGTGAAIAFVPHITPCGALGSRAPPLT